MNKFKAGTSLGKNSPNHFYNNLRPLSIAYPSAQAANSFWTVGFGYFYKSVLAIFSFKLLLGRPHQAGYSEFRPKRHLY
ncbi:hypothetical protein ABIB40_000611 [Pedobacter sp. UYP30]|uniref:hypothetical protein n=1 Tax=Pedobacter sp. UYP30 TaxID=1756400 RepID=UPI003398A333